MLGRQALSSTMTISAPQNVRRQCCSDALKLYFFEMKNEITRARPSRALQPRCCQTQNQVSNCLSLHVCRGQRQLEASQARGRAGSHCGNAAGRTWQRSNHLLEFANTHCCSQLAVEWGCTSAVQHLDAGITILQSCFASDQNCQAHAIHFAVRSSPWSGATAALLHVDVDHAGNSQLYLISHKI